MIESGWVGNGGGEKEKAKKKKNVSTG